MGDDYAGGGGVFGEDLVDALRESEPVGDGDVGAADVRDLLDFDVGEECDFGDGFDEIEAGEDAAFVFGEAGGGGALAGDGSAGGEDPDDGLFGGGWGRAGSEQARRGRRRARDRISDFTVCDLVGVGGVDGCVVMVLLFTVDILSDEFARAAADAGRRLAGRLWRPVILSSLWTRSFGWCRSCPMGVGSRFDWKGTSRVKLTCGWWESSQRPGRYA